MASSLRSWLISTRARLFRTPEAAPTDKEMHENSVISLTLGVDINPLTVDDTSFHQIVHVGGFQEVSLWRKENGP